MRFAALDISTKTGYAIFEDTKLLDYGRLGLSSTAHYQTDVKTFKDLPKDYPSGFVHTADTLATQCVEVFLRHDCELAVIEHTEKGKARLSQRLLEWINQTVYLEFRKRSIPVKYLFVSDWRTYTKCYLKFWPEYKIWNTKIAKLKKTAIPTKSGARIAKIEGKIVTKVNQKKLSIILANEAYGLQLKDDNIADAINLGRAAAVLCQGCIR
jgi:hypothetical protein